MGNCFDVVSAIVLMVLFGLAMYAMGFAYAMICAEKKERRK